MAFKILLSLAVIAVASCNASSKSPGFIVNGQETTVEEYPSVVQVEFLVGNAWLYNCAGTIINSLYFLSAAHCFYGSNYSPNVRRIRAGATKTSTGGEVKTIETAINYPSFDSNTLDGDLSVVRLSSRLTFTDTIQSSSIVPRGFELPVATPVVYAGWGTASADSHTNSDVLREVVVYTVADEDCEERYGNLPSPRLITGNMFCAGILGVEGSDACRHDAGGPVFLQEVLVGIISWGQGCGFADYPSVNTKIAAFTDWIVETAV